MIKGFLKRRRERKSIREWQHSFLGRALTSHTNEYFTKYPRLANFNQETKNKLVGDFFQAVFGLSQAENRANFCQPTRSHDEILRRRSTSGVE